MTAMPPAHVLPPTTDADTGWGASLQMQVARRGEHSRLVAARHVGPLRLQRPFYPEGHAHPHVYLLHPPGGMVPGDRLDIDIDISANASALITTPASGKVYDVGERALPQRQRIHAHIATGGKLEWLPQDTLFFNGARYAGDTTIHLQGDAQTIMWDIATLGRRAGNHPFIEGQVTQHLAIYRDGKPLLLERISLDAGSPLLDAPWGLGGARCWGTLIATGTTPKSLLETLRDICEQEASEQDTHIQKASTRISVTALKPLLVARYLGDCPLHAMRVFERLWTQLRPVMFGRDACAPRVWAT